MGKIITFTGESGTGKTTIVRTLLEEGFRLVRSSTTRKARPSDLLGEYEYLSGDKFVEGEKQRVFIWATFYAGNRYGTRYAYIDAALQTAEPHLMILVPDVVPLLLSYTPDVVPFFIRTLPADVLRERMQQRGDSTENIEKRLATIGLWEAQAEESGVSYQYIENKRTIQEAVQQVRHSLGKH